MEEDVFWAEIAVDDAAQLQFLQTLCDLAAVLDDLMFSKRVLFFGSDAIDLFFQRSSVHFFQHKHDIPNSLCPAIWQF